MLGHASLKRFCWPTNDPLGEIGVTDATVAARASLPCILSNNGQDPHNWSSSGGPLDSD